MGFELVSELDEDDELELDDEDVLLEDEDELLVVLSLVDVKSVVVNPPPPKRGSALLSRTISRP